MGKVQMSTRIKEEKKEHNIGREKTLHGRFMRCTEEVARSKTWEWLRRGELKKKQRV